MALMTNLLNDHTVQSRSLHFVSVADTWQAIEIRDPHLWITVSAPLQRFFLCYSLPQNDREDYKPLHPLVVGYGQPVVSFPGGRPNSAVSLMTVHGPWVRSQSGLFAILASDALTLSVTIFIMQAITRSSLLVLGPMHDQPSVITDVSYMFLFQTLGAQEIVMLRSSQMPLFGSLASPIQPPPPATLLNRPHRFPECARSFSNAQPGPRPKKPKGSLVSRFLGPCSSHNPYTRWAAAGTRKKDIGKKMTRICLQLRNLNHR